MRAAKVSETTLRKAAEEIGVTLEIDPVGRQFRVKLFPLVTETMARASGRRFPDARGDAAYQRESVGYGSAGRRVNAVCWHGFRDFFRAVYQIEPGAIFRTAVDTWRGSEDFEKRFAGTGHRNIGPQIAPAMMADACRCPDRGYAG
jgi:hypothetical protein